MISCAPMQYSLAQELDEFFFEEAQPRKGKEISHFPKTIRGIYKSEKDSTRRLRISGDSIFIELPMMMYATVKELNDKGYNLQDTVIINPEGKFYYCMQRGDTVLFVDYVQSNLFGIGKENEVKQAGNIYVCNFKTREGFYMCFLLIDDGNKLTIAQFDISRKQDLLEKNKKVKKMTLANPPSYFASFKEKDFKKFYEAGFFSIKQVYYKRYSWY